MSLITALTLKIFQKWLLKSNWNCLVGLLSLAQSLKTFFCMENQVQLTNNFLDSSEKKFRRIRLLLYSEDFDFAQSFSLYFRKDFQKIITVNDKETVLQIVNALHPEVIVLDTNVNDSFLAFIEQLKAISPNSRLYVFTSLAISQQDLIKRLNKLVDRIFYQPIDLIEFNQILNFHTADWKFISNFLTFETKK